MSRKRSIENLVWTASVPFFLWRFYLADSIQSEEPLEVSRCIFQQCVDKVAGDGYLSVIRTRFAHGG